MEHNVFGGRIRGTNLHENVDKLARKIAREHTDIYVSTRPRKNREQVFYVSYAAAKNAAARHLQAPDLEPFMRAGSSQHLATVDLPDSVDHFVDEDATKNASA